MPTIHHDQRAQSRRELNALRRLAKPAAPFGATLQGILFHTALTIALAVLAGAVVAAIPLGG